VFFGPPTAAFEKVAASRPPVDLRWSERLPALILLATLLLVGFWPRSLSDPINQTLQTTLSRGESAPVSVMVAR
jgi:NADH-quinone oxidoreductase subunit M